MISIILLIIIYLAFISLGLPDSIFGVTLPALRLEWALPLSAGSVISLTVVGSTIVSSFLSGFVIKKLGTAKVVLFSCLMTAGALLGISFVPSYFWLLLLAVPLGLGGGSIDTALNNHVALHFKARHMNWLHSFWGVGATIGPVIMSYSLLHEASWRPGFRAIAIIQLCLSFVLFLSLPLWRRFNATATRGTADDPGEQRKKGQNGSGAKAVYKIKGVKFAFATMMLYCAVEAAVGLWGSSFLIKAKGFSIEDAASWISFYYGGITAGRFLSGFITFKLKNTQMIRMGIIATCIGVFLLIMPIPDFFTGVSFVFIGLGLSPIFPAMLHETPARFGKEHSQTLIGFQMGFAYIGAAVLSPLLGVLLEHTAISLFPVYLAGFVITMFAASELLTDSTRKLPESEPDPIGKIP